MLKTYCKIALRVLFRNKTYSTLNILGLALSITCGILIFTLVTYHLSFDNFHKDSNRIYRFVTEQHRDNISYSSSVPPPFGKAFRQDYAFGEQTARIVTLNNYMIAVPTPTDPKKFREREGISFVEPAYFDIFNFPLLKGNKTTALTQPNTAIITATVAGKYFGKEDPVGKIIRLDNKTICTITGVLKDLPANSDQRAGIFVSWPTIRLTNKWYDDDGGWGGIATELQCFTRLRPGVKPAEVEKLLRSAARKK